MYFFLFVACIQACTNTMTVLHIYIYIGQHVVCSCILFLRDSQSALIQLGFMGWQRHVPRDNDPDALTELLSEVQENPSLMDRGLEDEDMYSVTDGLFDD